MNTIPMKRINYQSSLFVKKCYKELLSQNISIYFFKPSDEIKTNSEAGAYSPCMQVMHCMLSHLAKKGSNNLNKYMKKFEAKLN